MGNKEPDEPTACDLIRDSAEKACRIACDDCVRGDVLRDDSPSPDDSAITYCHTVKDNGVSTDPDITADSNWVRHF